MATKKRRRKLAALMPRLGPATNLRPAGAHESLKQYNRKRQGRITWEREVQDGSDYDANVD